MNWALDEIRVLRRMSNFKDFWKWIKINYPQILVEYLEEEE